MRTTLLARLMLGDSVGRTLISSCCPDVPIIRSSTVDQCSTQVWQARSIREWLTGIELHRQTRANAAFVRSTKPSVPSAKLIDK